MESILLGDNLERSIELNIVDKVLPFISRYFVLLVAIILVVGVVLMLTVLWNIKKIYDKGATILKGGVAGSIIKQLTPLYDKLQEGNSKCSSCGSTHKKGAEYCHNCGNSLFILCTECGSKINAEDKFCNKCGSRQA